MQTLLRQVGEPVAQDGVAERVAAEKGAFDAETPQRDEQARGVAVEGQENDGRAGAVTVVGDLVGDRLDIVGRLEHGVARVDAEIVRRRGEAVLQRVAVGVVDEDDAGAFLAEHADDVGGERLALVGVLEDDAKSGGIARDHVRGRRQRQRDHAGLGVDRARRQRLGAEGGSQRQDGAARDGRLGDLDGAEHRVPRSSRIVRSMRGSTPSLLISSIASCRPRRTPWA